MKDDEYERVDQIEINGKVWTVRDYWKCQRTINYPRFLSFKRWLWIEKGHPTGMNVTSIKNKYLIEYTKEFNKHNQP